MENCVERTRARLEDEEPGSTSRQRQVVAREMCRLLESRILDSDLDRDTVDIDYLVGRLDVRDGDDNPSLQEKWNNWLGQMNYLYDGDYARYQTH